MSIILASKDRWLVRFIYKDSDLSDSILEVDLDILRPLMA
jgi:hypothetical protein